MRWKQENLLFHSEYQCNRLFVFFTLCNIVVHAINILLGHGKVTRLGKALIMLLKESSLPLIWHGRIYKGIIIRLFKLRKWGILQQVWVHLGALFLVCHSFHPRKLFNKLLPWCPQFPAPTQKVTLFPVLILLYDSQVFNTP